MTRPEVAAAPAPELGALASALRPALWRYARTLGADAATADDLVQEAFVVALRRSDFDARHAGAVFTFLRTTCKQLWLRSQRRRGSERDVDEADAVWIARCGDGPGDDYVDALRGCITRAATHPASAHTRACPAAHPRARTPTP